VNKLTSEKENKNSGPIKLAQKHFLEPGVGVTSGMRPGVDLIKVGRTA
jgi:hypothetical protein